MLDYLSIAELYSKESKAKRAKVGAVLVLETGVLIPGYNGTPSGWSNACETLENGEISTKKSVLHAEENCILKAAKEGLSCKNAVLYVTLAPCLHCAALLAQVQVSSVIYQEDYRDMQGVSALNTYGISCSKQTKGSHV